MPVATLALGSVAETQDAIVRRLSEIQEQIDAGALGKGAKDYKEVLNRVDQLEVQVRQSSKDNPVQATLSSGEEVQEVMRRVQSLEAKHAELEGELEAKLDGQRLDTRRTLSESAEMTRAELSRVEALAQESERRMGAQVSNFRAEHDSLRSTLAALLEKSAGSVSTAVMAAEEPGGAALEHEQLRAICESLDEQMQVLRNSLAQAIDGQRSALHQMVQHELRQLEQKLAPQVDQLVQRLDAQSQQVDSISQAVGDAAQRRQQWASVADVQRLGASVAEIGREARDGLENVESRLTAMEGNVQANSASMEAFEGRFDSMLNEMSGYVAEMTGKSEALRSDVMSRVEDFVAQLDELRRQQDFRDNDIAIALRVGKTMDARIQALDSMRNEMHRVKEELLAQKSAAVSTTRCMACAPPLRPDSAGPTRVVRAKQHVIGGREVTQAAAAEGGSPVPKRVVGASTCVAPPPPTTLGDNVSVAWRESVWHSLARFQSGPNSRPPSARPVDLDAQMFEEDAGLASAKAELYSTIRSDPGAGAGAKLKTAAGSGMNASRPGSRPVTARGTRLMVGRCNG